MNIAERIVSDAETFARMCSGLGYSRSSIEGALVGEFNLTSEQAAQVTVSVMGAGSTNPKEG